MNFYGIKLVDISGTGEYLDKVNELEWIMRTKYQRLVLEAV